VLLVQRAIKEKAQDLNTNNGVNVSNKSKQLINKKFQKKRIDVLPLTLSFQNFHHFYIFKKTVMYEAWASYSY